MSMMKTHKNKQEEIILECISDLSDITLDAAREDNIDYIIIVTQ